MGTVLAWQDSAAWRQQQEAALSYIKGDKPSTFSSQNVQHTTQQALPRSAILILILSAFWGSRGFTRRLEAPNGAEEREGRETDLALLFVVLSVYYPLYPILTARRQETPSLTLIR